MLSDNNKHLDFRLIRTSPSGKTGVWEVHNRTTETDIGVVRWANNFRKYAFYPYDETYYDAGCMLVIASFMLEEMKEHNVQTT